MCVIIVKKANIELTDDVIKAAMQTNRDGAGFVWHDGTTAHCVKGLMTEADALAAWHKVPTDAPAIFHARIGTHAKNDAAHTHPFFVTSNYDAMERTCTYAARGYYVAHNGVFNSVDVPAGRSDTEAVVAQVLAPLARKGFALDGDEVRPLFGMLCGYNNRIAVMDAATGNIATFGNWQEVDGLLCSNVYWRATTARTYGGAGWSYSGHVGGYRGGNGRASWTASYWDDERADAKKARDLHTLTDKHRVYYLSNGQKVPQVTRNLLVNGDYAVDEDGAVYCTVGYGAPLKTGYWASDFVPDKMAKKGGKR